MRAIRWTVIAGLAIGIFVPAVMRAAAAATVPTDVQTCPVPIINLDPDSVTLSGPVPSTTPGTGPVATATVAASETPAELGPGAPTVRLFIYRMDGTNPIQDLINGLSGPSTSGAASLSGPATGSGVATESLSFAAPGSYTFGFLTFFDNGIHPCASFFPFNHSLTVNVP